MRRRLRGTLMEPAGIGHLAARLRSMIPGGTLLLAVLLAAGLHVGHLLDSDEGVVLNGAWQLRHGMQPYTDFFDIVGPASFYVVYWAWLALGPTYWAAKLVGVCAVVAAVLGMHRLAQAALPPGAALPPTLPALPALLFALQSGFWQTINHNTFSVPGAVWTAVFAARALERGGRGAAAASGVLAGLTALFLPHRAAALAAGVVLALLWVPERRRCVPAFVVGVVAGAAPLLYWPVDVLMEHLVLFPLRHYNAVNGLAPLLPTAAAVAGLGAACVLRGQRNATAAMLLFLLVPLLAGVQRADFTHVTQNMFPLVALVPAVAVQNVGTHAGRAIQGLTIAFVAAMSLPVLPRLQARWPGDGLRGEVVDAVHAACAGSAYLYAGPFLPEFYFETGKRSPTRHAVLLTGYNTAAQFDAAAAALARAAPPCALTDYDAVAKFGYSRDNPVDRYLARHYAPVRAWPGGLVLWRRQP